MSEASSKNSAKKGFKAPILNVSIPEGKDNSLEKKESSLKLKQEVKKVDERKSPPGNESYKQEKKTEKNSKQSKESGKYDTSPTKQKKFKKPEVSLTDSQYEAIFKAVLQSSNSQHDTPNDELLDSVVPLSQKSSSKGCLKEPLPESQGSVKTSVSLRDEAGPVPEISPWGSHLSKQNSQASSILKELQASQASSLLSPEPTSSSEDTDDGAADVVLPQRSVRQLSQCSNSSRRQVTKIRKVDKRAVLEELQALRNVGLWVYCDRLTCQKQRYLPHVTDPQELPDIWYCHMNPDPRYNSCSCEEQQPSAEEEEDMIDNEFTCGSLVWARLAGFPWWPAMVDDDPDLECYYWLDEEDFRTVTWYHVVFFDKNEVTRAWIPVKKVVSFKKNLNSFKQRVVRGMDFTARLQVAREQAEEAEAMTIAQRLKTFSFIARYKGPILDDQKQICKTMKKFKLKSSKGKKGAEKRGRKRHADTKENHTPFEKIVKREDKQRKFTVENFVKSPVSNEVKIPVSNDDEKNTTIDTEFSEITQIKSVEIETNANKTKTQGNLSTICEKQTENLNPESRFVERILDKNEDYIVSETPSGIGFDPKNTAQEELLVGSNENKPPSISGSNVSQKSKPSSTKPAKPTEEVRRAPEMTQMTYSFQAEDQDSAQNKLSQSTIADFLASEMEDAVVPETDFSQHSEPFEE